MERAAIWAGVSRVRVTYEKRDAERDARRDGESMMWEGEREGRGSRVTYWVGGVGGLRA